METNRSPAIPTLEIINQLNKYMYEAAILRAALELQVFPSVSYLMNLKLLIKQNLPLAPNNCLRVSERHHNKPTHHQSAEENSSPLTSRPDTRRRYHPRNRASRQHRIVQQASAF